MLASGTNSGTSAQANGLPLFRPEALAAQQKLHGTILLIRPFSLIFFGWLGIGLTITILAFLFTGSYIEKGRVLGSLATVPDRSAAATSTMSVVLDVPARWIGAVQPGATVVLRCTSCPNPERSLSAKVTQVEKPAPDTAAVTMRETVKREAVYRVTVAFAPEVADSIANANSLQLGGATMEAELPLGRKSLMHWFFEPIGR